MIRTILDNVTVNGNDYASGELLCNSPVLRKTVDENEKINLIEHPNFILTIVSNDHMYINQRVPVSFSVDNNDVTAYATVVSSMHLVGGDQYRLMYSDGMNVTEGDDSSDDDHSLEFNYSVFSTSYNLGTGESVDSVQCQLLYDGEAVKTPYSYFDKQGVDGYSYNNYEGKLYGVVWSPKTYFPEMAVGTFTDTVTASYMGNTAICQVVLTVTETVPEVDPVLSESINTILGSNYDVVNDMSEEDGLAAANNILYGETTPA